MWGTILTKKYNNLIKKAKLILKLSKNGKNLRKVQVMLLELVRMYLINIYFPL